MMNVKEIADHSDMIINGYAFTKEDEIVRVLNLHDTTKAAVIRNDEIIETSMDDIEMAIVIDYYLQNKVYMEDGDYAEVL